MHLRICLTCGHVGCCDSSAPRHATAHHQATGHPVIRSYEPGEDWRWCYWTSCSADRQLWQQVAYRERDAAGRC